AVEVLIWFGWLNVPLFFHVGRAKWLILEGKIAQNMGYSLVLVIANGLFQYLLTGKYFEVGAIWAALFAAVSANAILAIFSSSIRESLGMWFKSLTFPLRLLKGNVEL